MISRRRCMTALGGLALAQTLPGCSWLVDKPITVGLHVWPGYEPMSLAGREGMLDRNRVRLVETKSATESLRLLASGALDGAALTLDEVLTARSNGIPLSVVMVFDVSAGADVLLARPGITHLSQIKGRSVGFEQGAVNELMLTEALRTVGLTRNDVTLVPLVFNQQLDAWRRNRVDACITFEPVASHLLALGAVRLFDSRQLPDAIVDVLAIHRTALDRSHAGALRHLIRGHFQALEHLQQSPQDAAYRMAGHMNLPAAAVLASFKGIVLADNDNNHRLLSGPTPELLATARKLSKIMVGSGLLEEDDTMTALIRSEFLPPRL